VANALTTEQVEGLRWLVETCGGRVTMYPVVPMYPVMEGLFEAGLVGRELPQFPEERTLFEALDPTCRTVLATLEEAGQALAEQFVSAGREEAFEEIDAAVDSLVKSSESHIMLGGYDHAVTRLGVVCCVDERLSGQFTLAGFSYSACILQSALEDATEANRSAISDRNVALVKSVEEVDRD